MDSKEFFYDFGRALYHIDSFYDGFAKQSKVSPALLWVLYALNDGRSHTQIEICNDWQLPKTTVNTVVKEIEQAGYVKLLPIEGKRREMNIVLTKRGKKYADKLLSDLYEIEEKVFESLGAKDRDVVRTLERISERLKERC